jgi:hypothetical protein
MPRWKTFCVLSTGHTCWDQKPRESVFQVLHESMQQVYGLMLIVQGLDRKPKTLSSPCSMCQGLGCCCQKPCCQKPHLDDVLVALCVNCAGHGGSGLQEVRQRHTPALLLRHHLDRNRRPAVNKSLVNLRVCGRVEDPLVGYQTGS